MVNAAQIVRNFPRG